MLETGVRQLRMALSMVWGRPFNTDSLTRLVADAVATIAEFGELGLEAREVIETPFADDADRIDHADRSLRRTARRLAELSPFYAEWFAAHGFEARTADATTLLGLPVTTKHHLMSRPARLPLPRQPAAPGHPDDGHHRPGPGGLAVPVRARGRCGARRPERGPARRAPRRRPDAGARQLPGDRGRAALRHDVPPGGCALPGPGHHRRRRRARRARRQCHRDVGQRQLSRRAGRRRRSAGVSARRLPAPPHRLRERDPVTRCAHRRRTGLRCTGVGQLRHDRGHPRDRHQLLGRAPPSRPDHGARGGSRSAGRAPRRRRGSSAPSWSRRTSPTGSACRSCGTTLATSCVSSPDRSTARQAGIPATSAVLGKAEPADPGHPDARRHPAGSSSRPSRTCPAGPGRLGSTRNPQDGRLRIDLPAGAVAGLSSDGLTDHFAERGLDAQVRVLEDHRAPGLRRVRSDLRELSFAAAERVGA